MARREQAWPGVARAAQERGQAAASMEGRSAIELRRRTRARALSSTSHPTCMLAAACARHQPRRTHITRTRARAWRGDSSRASTRRLHLGSPSDGWAMPRAAAHHAPPSSAVGAQRPPVNVACRSHPLSVVASPSGHPCGDASCPAVRAVGPSAEQCVSDVLFALTAQGTAGGLVGSPVQQLAYVTGHRRGFFREQDQEAAVGSCAEAMAEAD